MKKMIADGDRLVDRREVARLLGVCEKSVKRYCERGVLPAPIVLSAKERRWFLSDILTALEMRR